MSSVWYVDCKDCAKNIDGMCSRLKRETPVEFCFSGVFKSAKVKRKIEEKEFEKQYRQYIVARRKFKSLEKTVIKKKDWHLMNLLLSHIDKTLDDMEYDVEYER